MGDSPKVRDKGSYLQGSVSLSVNRVKPSERSNVEKSSKRIAGMVKIWRVSASIAGEQVFDGFANSY